MDLVINVLIGSFHVFAVFNLFSCILLTFFNKHLSQNTEFMLNRMSYVILRISSIVMIVPFTILLFKETITAKEFIANFAGVQFIYLLMALVWNRTEEK